MNDHSIADSPTYRVIGYIWSEVLGLSPPFEFDFFGLGGDSLKAFQITSRMTEVFEVELLPTVLFDFPHLSELANHIETSHGGKVREAAERILREIDESKALPDDQ